MNDEQLAALPAPADARLPDAQLDRGALKSRWVLEIDRYERKAQPFDKRGKKIIDRYSSEKKDEESTNVRYNSLWSNIQTLRPALYAKDPTPEVERRFKDKDPVGRVASDVLERCIAYLVQKQGFGDTMRQVILDRLLPGRGVAWVRYVPHMRDAAVQGSPDTREDGQQLTTAVDSDPQAPVQEVYWEEVRFDFVPWTDFGHTVARTWEEADGVWRIVYLSREELVERFGEIGHQVPLDQQPEGLSKEGQEGQPNLSKGKVYEIWDKKTKRAIWLNRSVAKVLDVLDDPLHLEGFFPCPKPLQATTTSKSLIPTADYVAYADQAAELDRLTQRIAHLTRAIKVVGVYDASVPALQQLLNAGTENKLVPVDSFASFAEKGGLKGAVELLPVDMIAQVLLQLYEARDHVKQDLYEISGLSDLLRGASDPETTATAERIKGAFASVRLKDMQREVQAFARDLIRIGAEIVAEHFSLETIQQISGVRLLRAQEKQLLQMRMQMQAQGAQPGMPPAPALPPVKPEELELLKEPSWEDVEALLRDNAARGFRIDIETDSTIAQDERAEQDARVSFAQTVGELLKGATEVLQNVPELAPAIGETFMFVLRSFKVGRPTESAFQEAMDKLSEKAKQPQQAKPDPAQIKAQADMQMHQQKIQSDERMAQFQAQLDAWVSQQQQIAQQQQVEAQERAEQQSAQFQAALNEHLAQMQQAADERAAAADRNMQLVLAHIKANSAIEVAEIGSQTTLQAAQISAASAATGGNAGEGA